MRGETEESESQNALCLKSVEDFNLDSLIPVNIMVMGGRVLSKSLFPCPLFFSIAPSLSCLSFPDRIPHPVF
ncbi:hypothetical protein L6452_37412 [Arctium lappa]|uniref:Uncharacterized protein n=1 Tax=Arctium lappa TaxID=4217 RepID=A0ACB8Y296_ARCLA|nr:hypothetical protein L6452_37412 [Arctium lappa]